MWLGRQPKVTGGGRKACDVDGYSSAVPVDAVMMYAEQPAVVGHGAIRPFVSGFFQKYHFEFGSWQSEEIKIEGNPRGRRGLNGFGSVLHSVARFASPPDECPNTDGVRSPGLR